MSSIAILTWSSSIHVNTDSESSIPEMEISLTKEEKTVAKEHSKRIMVADLCNCCTF